MFYFLNESGNQSYFCTFIILSGDIFANIFLAQHILVPNIMFKRVKPFNIVVHHKVRESSLTKSRNCVLAFETLYKCTLKELQMIKSDILANENHFPQQNNSAFIVLVIAAIALKD